MLSKEYMNFLDFKRKISNITTIKELKDIANECHVEISVRLTAEKNILSVINWNLTKDTFSGTLWINLNVKLESNGEIFSSSKRIVEFKIINQYSLDLEDFLVENIKKSIAII